jgi:hypothetical protein
MKPTSLLVFAASLCAGVTFGQTADDEPLPLVTLGPARLDLQPVPQYGSPSKWSLLKLAITNRTKRTWRFCRFYECYSLILLSDTGKLVPMTGAGRDATLGPKITDFPIVVRGQSATASRGCAVIQNGRELAFVSGDGTGTEWGYTLQPGHYKLCVEYRFHPEEPYIFATAVKHFGLKVNSSDVWPGWQVSNWIDLYVSKSK